LINDDLQMFYTINNGNSIFSLDLYNKFTHIQLYHMEQLDSELR